MKQRTIQILSISLFVTLLVWGIYSLLAYIGMPVHGSMLLDDPAMSPISDACPDPKGLLGPAVLMCRGIHTLWPFVMKGMLRLGYLWVYAVLSLILYGAFVGIQWLRTESFHLRLTLRPWHFLVLFVLSLWLLFTTLAYSNLPINGPANQQQPMPRVYQPTTDVYPGADQKTIDSLQANLDQLQAKHCLTDVGTLQGGSNVYDLKGICIQGSFVRNVFSEVVLVLLLIFEFLVLGRALLRLFRLRVQRPLLELVLSFGLGACGFMAVLWLIAVLWLYTQVAGWALLILVPLALYKHSLYWLRRLHDASFDVEVDTWSLSVLLVWLLVTYLAFNFLTVVRPFPIGWDDLGSYLNRPRLLVSYGHAISAMGTFQWEYITSLGFLLFGYDSIFGATSSMLINWMEGLYAVMVVFAFGNLFMGRRRGILAALIYYTLPLVGHFSFADMKIDNAVFATSALAILTAFIALFMSKEDGTVLPADGEDMALADESVAAPMATTNFWDGLDWRWIFLSGIFTAFAFGMKSTSTMVFMAIIAVLFGVLLNWSTFLSGIFFAFAVFAFQGVLVVHSIFSRIGLPDIPQKAFAFGFFVVGLIPLLLTLRHMGRWKRFGQLLGLYLLGFLVAVAPWLAYNNIMAGNLVPHLELSPPNFTSPRFDLFGNMPDVKHVVTKHLPADLRLKADSPACKATGGTEELDRYWGFSKGWGHYLTLPWRAVMNADSGGYYVTTVPALLLLPLLLLLPFFWTRKGRWLRWLFVGTLFIVVQWVFLGNGIPWYGASMLLGLALGLEALMAYSPDPFSRWTTGILLTFTILSAFSMRMWQFEQQQNLVEYPIGKVSADAMRVRTIKWYDDIRQAVVSRNQTLTSQPYLYRMGTFIPYFIPKNSEIIGITDNQLDTFHCLNQEENHELTLKRLQALGFNSMVFDTNTATIEADQHGSLHKKVQEFLDFVNDPKVNVQVVVNDSNAGVAFLLLPQ